MQMKELDQLREEEETKREQEVTERHRIMMLLAE